MTTECEQWLLPAQVFDGYRLLNDTTIGINGGEIAAIVPVADLPKSASVQRSNKIVSPGFSTFRLMAVEMYYSTPAPIAKVFHASLRRMLRQELCTGCQLLLPTAQMF